ncbi:hypothetical protein SAMN05444171_1037 [Bradyrhizobium lablabi]|uniref:Antitoxin Xre/MbcA/ParS-like toxin-binding domain-containing protein n=2 Tax=Bradyrhizobium TaxID=374 RepID=A0ABY0Q8B9_9BRAD|nr:hypothetical protein SAMN05444163_6122 [Bradyrhizobium ottawaense]SEC27385.1 hypothetical protein SAMN05444171_1037 [Bradyrhizobium lablabi]
MADVGSDNVRRLLWINEAHTEYWARYPRRDWSKGGVPVVRHLEGDALRIIDAVFNQVRGAPMMRMWD